MFLWLMAAFLFLIASGFKSQAEELLDQKILVINSEPIAAEVVVNNHKTGITPDTLRLTENSCLIQLWKYGYQRLDTFVTLAEPGLININLVLEPLCPIKPGDPSEPPLLEITESSGSEIICGRLRNVDLCQTWLVFWHYENNIWVQWFFLAPLQGINLTNGNWQVQLAGPDHPRPVVLAVDERYQAIEKSFVHPNQLPGVIAWCQ